MLWVHTVYSNFEERGAVWEEANIALSSLLRSQKREEKLGGWVAE